MASRSYNQNNAELNVFFMNTTKLEKIAQLNAQASNRDYPVLFLPATSLGEPAHSPEELSGSFKLNKNTKLLSCAQYLSQFTYDQVLAAVEPLGISRADLEQKKVKLYGCAEDSGMSFDRGHPQRTKEFVDMFFNTSSSGPYKTDADKELVRSLERFIGWEKPLIEGGEKQRKSFPGVETVRVMGAAGGVDNFFRLTEQVMKKLKIPVEPPPRSINRLDFVDNSMLGAFEWHPEQGKDFVKQLYQSNFKEGEGESRSTYFRHPNEGDEKLTYSRTSPTGRFSQGHSMSREQLGELYQPQARGEALGFLIDKFDIKKIKAGTWQTRIGNRKKTPTAEERASDYTVSVLPADKDYQHHHLADDVGKAVHGMQMHVKFPKQEGTRTRVWSELGLFQNMLDSSDAFMFLPSGVDKKSGKQTGKDYERNLELHHAASQFFEHITLYPQGKPKLGVFVEHKEGDYNKFIKPFTELFNRGAFGDRPTKLIVPAKSVDEGVKLLQEHRKQYRPVLTHPEPDSAAKLLKNPDSYHVCVFLSASMEGIWEDKAYALGKRIQEAGMGLTYGAADRNAMGAVFKGFMDSRKKHGGDAVVLGSTTRVIAATECEHGTKPEELPEKNYYLAPSIPKRKEFLFKNSDALVVLEGGVGTFDELLTYLYLKKTNSDLVKNKPLVVCESAYTKGSMYKQALDDYFGCDSSKVDEKTMRAKGVYIVKPMEKLPEGSGDRRLFDYDIDNAMKILEKHRANGWASDVKRRREIAASAGISVTH